MRRKLLLIAGMSVVLVALAIWWFAQPTDRVNTANYDRIEIGMSEEQVVQIIGKPDVEDENTQEEITGASLRTAVKCWSGRGQNTILVYFDIQKGRCNVEGKQCFLPSLWDRTKAWLGGYELKSDLLRPNRIPGGRTKRLESPA